MQDNDIIKANSHALKKEMIKQYVSLRFQKYKSTFLYKPINDIVCVADIQKSSWSWSYYLNYGIWIQEIAEYPLCPPHQCHLGFRIGNIPGMEDDCRTTYEYDGNASFIDKLLDLEVFFSRVNDYSIDLHERIKVVQYIFQDLLPTFFSKLSMEYFKEVYFSYEHGKSWARITTPALRLFAPHIFNK